MKKGVTQTSDSWTRKQIINRIIPYRFNNATDQQQLIKIEDLIEPQVQPLYARVQLFRQRNFVGSHDFGVVTSWWDLASWRHYEDLPWRNALLNQICPSLDWESIITGTKYMKNK